MALVIGRFVTRCQVSRRRQMEASVVDRLARQRLAVDLAGHLGPSLSRQAAIVRIRFLPVEVRIPASELNDESLSRAWTAAFGRALFTALAYPSGVGPFEVYQAGSVAEFIAGAVRSLLGGDAGGRWEYAEFEEMLRQGPVQGALALLCAWPDETLPILLALEQAGSLGRVLAPMNELALERLLAALASSEDVEPPPLTVSNLADAARIALAFLPPNESLRSRRQTLLVFVQARRAGRWPRSPRALFHSLWALDVLLRSGNVEGNAVLDESFAPNLPPAVVAVLSKVRQIGRQEAGGTAKPERLAPLRQALESLRAMRPVPVDALRATAADVRQVSSQWCGLFFLCGRLERLGWVARWQRLPQFQTGGVSPLLAGLALAICGELRPEALDPGLAVFAGYAGEPGLAHLQAFLEQDHPELQRAILEAAMEHPPADAAASLEGTLHAVAEALLTEWASRIRGFRQASHPSLVRNFLRRPGMVRVEPERIVIQPEPSPFHVALHVSGMDAAVPSLSWLGGRRLEFHMEEL